MMKKIITSSKSKIRLSLLILLIAAIFAIPSVIAHCPLCTGATVAGVGVTRALGLDDSIIGVLVGGMIISSALWINNIFKKRNIKGNNALRITGLIIATSILTILTFYYAGFFGPGNEHRIFGIEKITFGTISGGAISLAAFGISNKIKEKRGGKVLFNYQTMIMTFAALILNVLAFWLIF